MKPLLLLLGSLCLTLPACLIPQDDDDISGGDWCTPGWDDLSADQIQLGHAGDRNLASWRVDSTVQVAGLDDRGAPADGGRVDPLADGAVLVSDGSRYLSLRVDRSVQQLRGRMLDAEGAPIGIDVVLGPSGSYPALRGTFDGERYWVAWGDDQDGEDTIVRVARVGLDGTLLDAEPIVLDTGGAYEIDIASAGAVAWAVWQRGGVTTGVRIDADGVVLDAEPWILLGASTSAHRLVARGDDALLVGQRSPDGALVAQRLGPDGPRSAPVEVSARLDDWRVVALIADPTRDGYLLVSSRNDGGASFPCTDCRIEVDRLDADGLAALRPMTQFEGLRPAVSFTGEQLLVAYVTHTRDAERNGAWALQTRPVYLDRPVGDAVPLDAGAVQWDDCD